MECNPLEYQHHRPEKALDDYIHTTRHLLEGVIADQGKAFEAYLDSVAPDGAVDEMTEDFIHRYHGCFRTKQDAIESLMGSHYLEKYSVTDLWAHLETFYEVVTYADDQIYLFVPATGGRHGRR